MKRSVVVVDDGHLGLVAALQVALPAVDATEEPSLDARKNGRGKEGKQGEDDDDDDQEIDHD